MGWIHLYKYDILRNWFLLFFFINKVPENWSFRKSQRDMITKIIVIRTMIQWINLCPFTIDCFDREKVCVWDYNNFKYGLNSLLFIDIFVCFLFFCSISLRVFLFVYWKVIRVSCGCVKPSNSNIWGSSHQ